MPLVPQWGISDRVQTVAETPTFSRQADKLFNNEAMPIYVLLAYAKARQPDLTPREKRTVAALAAALKAAWNETT